MGVVCRAISFRLDGPDHKSGPGTNDASGSESEEDTTLSKVDNCMAKQASQNTLLQNVPRIVQTHILEKRIFSSYCATTDSRVSCYSEGICGMTVQLLKPFHRLHFCTQQLHNAPSQFLMILYTNTPFVVSQYTLRQQNTQEITALCKQPPLAMYLKLSSVGQQYSHLYSIQHRTNWCHCPEASVWYY